MSRKWLWTLFLLAGGGAAFILPVLVAQWNSAPMPLGESGAQLAPFPQPEESEYILVVGRRAERMGIEEPIPHRNSRVALYEAEGGKWRKVASSLPIRSKTTAEAPPPVETFVGSQSRTYGYVSVPFGIFTMEQGVWRDGETTAFRLGDWGRFDGSIGLAAPQVLRRKRRVDTATSGNDSGEPHFEETVLRSSLEKRGSWIHPTRTQQWSHGDSHGCMNLFRPEDPDHGEYDYDIFLSWFSQRNLELGSEGALIPLIVLPFESVADHTGNGELRPVLEEAIFEEARHKQGHRIEESPQ